MVCLSHGVNPTHTRDVTADLGRYAIGVSGRVVSPFLVLSGLAPEAQPMQYLCVKG